MRFVELGSRQIIVAMKRAREKKSTLEKRDVVFWIVALSFTSVIVWAVLLMTSCTPKDEITVDKQIQTVDKQIQIESRAGDYGARIAECRARELAKGDAGSFRAFQACACDVDRQAGIDARSAGAECP